MKIKLDIKRFNQRTREQKWQSFEIEADKNDTAADLLKRLNEKSELRDINGEKAESIAFECGCMQKKCGACAMVINGVPRLACEAFVRELCKKSNIIKLEPLSKFPVIEDLRVDRSKLYADLRDMHIWLEGKAEYNKKEWELQYTSASCLMCGCCLEVCPSYTSENKFTGAAVMNSAYRVASQRGAGKNRELFLKENIKSGSGHCSKTLSCESVCPMNIPIGLLVSRMNRMFISKSKRLPVFK